MQKIEIDELGLSSPGLTIIGGRPAMGKTSFMLSIALDMAMHGNPVAIFSLEMSEKQLFIRLLSNICNLPLGEIRYKNELSDSEIAQVCLCTLMTLSVCPSLSCVRKLNVWYANME